jgi:arylsulfatase A-like enzyme
LDYALGGLLAKLEEIGEREKTILVFAGDNGLALGQHGLMGKHNLSDHSVRVPLIFSGPGIAKGRRCDALCLLADIYPTLCALCGLPVPESVESRDLSPLLREEGSCVNPHESLYLVYGETIRGVTTGRYKLIEYATGPTQLFDLDTDPHEIRNLASEPSYGDTLVKLRKCLRLHHKRSGEDEHEFGTAFWEDRPDLCFN